jgi:hypothetical protein
MGQSIGMPGMLDGYGQQPPGAPHQAPVIFEGCATGQADLIVASLVVDARPGEAVRTTLSEKLFEKIH